MEVDSFSYNLLGAYTRHPGIHQPEDLGFEPSVQLLRERPIARGGHGQPPLLLAAGDALQEGVQALQARTPVPPQQVALGCGEQGGHPEVERHRLAPDGRVGGTLLGTLARMVDDQPQGKMQACVGAKRIVLPHDQPYRLRQAA